MTATDPPRIVVGVDGSVGSIAALRWAGRMAQLLGARIDAVAVWEYAPLFGARFASLDFPGPDVEASLNQTIDEVFDGQRPSGLRAKVLEGSAAEILLTVGEGAAMIVVGSRGRGGFSDLLLGSVSTRVAERAACPVLVVHGDGPQL